MKQGWFFRRRKPSLMDRLEEWLPEEIVERIPPALEQALRKRLDKIDASKVETLLGARLGRLDRAAAEELLRAGLEALNSRRATGREMIDAARSRVPDRASLEAAIREGIEAILPERLEQLLRERVEAVKPPLSKAAQSVAKPRPTTPPVPAISSAEQSANVPLALLNGAGRLAFFAVVGWIAYSNFMVEHQVKLPKAIEADLMTVPFQPTGPLTLYRDVPNAARPLLLIHSINAAASAYEMRPIFQHFRTERPTYALDLPGFGFSARPKYAYSPATYVAAIHAALDAIRAEHGKVAVDVVALSLGCEFAAEAARQRPDTVRALVLISPSGMQAKPVPRLDQWLYPAFTFGLWARPFFDLLTTKRSINYFLGQSFAGPIPPGLVDYAYATAHQPGAEHAPLAFVSGRLFTPDAVDRIYRQVQQPVLVIYDEDAFVRFDRLAELTATLPNWRSARIVPTKGIPHWEKPAETNRVIDEFLADVG